jgi:hypothetical protein
MDNPETQQPTEKHNGTTTINRNPLQENRHLAAAKNGRKALKTAGKFKKRQN